MRSLVTRFWPVDRAAFTVPRSTARSCPPPGAFRLGAVALVAYPIVALSQVVTPSQVTPQTVAPSQVTPETLRPAATGAPDGLQLSGGARTQIPAGTTALSFIVGRVRIEGAFPELENETRSLVRAIEGHRVTVAQIYELANVLEQAYARAGYVLVRVAVPPQKLNDRGPLRILVVDGHRECTTDNVPTARVWSPTAWPRLIGRRHVSSTRSSGAC